MSYADYTYYGKVYMGTVREEDFPRLSLRAENYINYFTQGRAGKLFPPTEQPPEVDEPKEDAPEDETVETQGIGSVSERDPVVEAVKMCVCALVDKYAMIEAAQETAVNRLLQSHESERAVKSETVGGYSRTLATGEEEAAAALNVAQMAEKLLAQTCTAYLAHTGLLYRGGGGGRCTLPTL